MASSILMPAAERQNNRHIEQQGLDLAIISAFPLWYDNILYRKNVTFSCQKQFKKDTKPGTGAKVQPFLRKAGHPRACFWADVNKDLEKQALGEPVPLRAVCLRAGNHIRSAETGMGTVPASHLMQLIKTLPAQEIRAPIVQSRGSVPIPKAGNGRLDPLNGCPGRKPCRMQMAKQLQNPEIKECPGNRVIPEQAACI